MGDAAAAFKQATEVAPYDVRYLGDLARAYLELAQKGDTAAGQRARDAAEGAVLTDPNNPQAQFTRALVMQATGNVPEAVRSAERALALDPQSMTDALWVTATQVELASDHPTKAVSLARQGLVVFGATRRTIPLRMELARALVASGSKSDALRELDAALSIQPNEPSVLQLRAQIAAGSGS
jgi:Tfp pilus assembly protein PilF